MARSDRLTRGYFDGQVKRVLAAADRIRSRSAIQTGWAIPSSGDLPIHAGRRIEAAVMFLDICKFSQRASWTQAEQENNLRILSLFFSEMIRIVQDYDGVVEKNTGDGLMAYFTQKPGADAPAQQVAVAASLTMFSAATTLINPILQASQLAPLDFRICLDYGPITVAQVGAARGFNGIVAIGTTANIASKMLGVADPNTVLIGTKLLHGLPSEWQRDYVVFKTAETGWNYTDNGEPYAFWQYDGRWALPLA